MGTLTTSRPMPAVMAAVAVRLRSSSELWSSSATRLLVADGLQSPSNLGMAIRTADAAGVDAVVVAGANADPLDKHSIRAARGAVGRLPIFACEKLPEWLDFLRDRGFEVVGATASAGTTIYEAPLNLPLAAIVGNESEGIRREVLERCSSTVAIPMAPGQDSLNVGVAAGILLYELVRRRRREVPEGSELGS